MATEEMIKTITNLFNKYCPLGDPLHDELMSWFLIYTHGTKHFDQRCHLSAIGPDDFANTRLGKMTEAIAWNPFLTTFSDLSLRPGTNQEKKIGTTIIYVEKKLRHSEEYERLCQLMRDGYFKNGQSNVVIIGSDGFIDRKIINRTIHLYVPPFQKHVPGFFSSKLEDEIKKVREAIEQFWTDDLPTILDRRDTFPGSDWLKNQDQQSWLPILALSKAYSALLRQPIYFKNMLTLAKKMVTSKTLQESAVPLAQKVLEATFTFIKERKPMKEKSKRHPKVEFYYGPEMHKFIQTMLRQPDLRKEEISEILNNHHVVKCTWRPRIEEKVINEEESSEGKKESTKKKKEKIWTQFMCYAFDKEELSKALKTYPSEVNYEDAKP